MNRIEDERIKFYLEHETRIREWAGLEAEVRKFVDRFYGSLKDDLDAALRSRKIADDGVMAFFDEHHNNWPGVGLRQQVWPEGDKKPDVRLEWHRKSKRVWADDSLVCGVRTTKDCYRQPFTEGRCPSYPFRNAWWPAFRKVDPPVDRIWEGDKLKHYRDDLVETILTAWRDLAWLVDEAVGPPTV